METVTDGLWGGPVGAEDVRDAAGAGWRARRIHAGTAERCPSKDAGGPRNDRGLRMEIWR